MVCVFLECMFLWCVFFWCVCFYGVCVFYMCVCVCVWCVFLGVCFLGMCVFFNLFITLSPVREHFAHFGDTAIAGEGLSVGSSAEILANAWHI